MHYSVNEADDSHIVVELDSPNGPRVTVPADAEADDILAALPVGWTVHPDDWQSQVTLLGGRHAYPLSRDDGGAW